MADETRDVSDEELQKIIEDAHEMNYTRKDNLLEVVENGKSRYYHPRY